MIAATIVVESNRFGSLAGEFDRTVEDALDLGVLTAIEVADPLTPVDTGALRANKSITGGSGWREITWNQDYSGFVELGTIYMAPRPFARPGAEAAEPVIVNALGRFGR